MKRPTLPEGYRWLGFKEPVKPIDIFWDFNDSLWRQNEFENPIAYSPCGVNWFFVGNQDQHPNYVATKIDQNIPFWAIFMLK